MAARTLIFDLDGTVWDSWPWYAEVAEREGEIEGVEESLRAGKPPIATILRNAGIREARLRHIARSDCCALYDGVREALEALQQGGAEMGIATNLPAWIAEPMLEVLGLDSFFGETVTYGKGGRPKPHPDPIEACLRGLGREASSDVWYVGDTKADATSAARAGVSFAWAAYGYGPDQPSCDAVLDEFSATLRL